MAKIKAATRLRPAHGASSGLGSVGGDATGSGAPAAQAGSTSGSATTTGDERTETTLWPNGSVTADSASLTDVQAAVDAASDGQRVLIPNGDVTWAGGISTTKQILIRAQNYTPTAAGTEGAGTMSRNVTIASSTTSPLFTFTTGNTYHVGVAGIRFDAGADHNYLSFSGSGTKVPLLSDCSFEWPLDNGNNPGDAFVAWLCLGGVMWNCYWESTRTNPDDIGALGVFLDSPRSWETASTMGTLDTDGNINVYVEDSTSVDNDAIFDVDKASRLVVRNCFFEGSWFLTHGFTSGVYEGGRAVEIYDNQFQSTTTDPNARNLAGRYFWLRAGTVLITGNNFDGPVDTEAYGPTLNCLQIGDNTAPSGNDGPMQPGWGHNGSTDVRDPMYVWSNTGDMGSSVGFNTSSGNWDTVTNVATEPEEADGELFVDLGAKPGWTRYTYPHPLRYTPA